MDNEELERRMADHEERLKKVETSTNEFFTFREVINIKFDAVLKTLDNLVDTVSSLKQRPADKWDKLIFAVIGAAGSGLVGLLISQLTK